MKDLSVVLADVARAMFDADTVDETLQVVVDGAERAVAGCDGAAVVIVQGDGAYVAAASDERARAAEQAEVDLRQGPCLQALRDHALIASHDLAAEDRWPEWTAVALDLGFRCLLGFRLFAGERSYGALDLYATRPHAFTDEARSTGLAMAAHGAIALANVARHEVDEREATELSNALASRDVIGQAKGILMERERLSADEAFDRLRAVSQRQNRKLRDVAADVAETGELPG